MNKLYSEMHCGVSLAPNVGEVSELVDEHDLGSCAERRPGSSPGFPTNKLVTVIDPVTYLWEYAEPEETDWLHC